MERKEEQREEEKKRVGSNSVVHFAVWPFGFVCWVIGLFPMTLPGGRGQPSSCGCRGRWAAASYQSRSQSVCPQSVSISWVHFASPIIPPRVTHMPDIHSVRSNSLSSLNQGIHSRLYAIEKTRFSNGLPHRMPRSEDIGPQSLPVVLVRNSSDLRHTL